MTKQHNGYWISGTAVPGPPYATYGTPYGCVLRQHPSGSVVQLTRFTPGSFGLKGDSVAAWFEVELARMVVDECLTHHGAANLTGLA